MKLKRIFKRTGSMLMAGVVGIIFLLQTTSVTPVSAASSSVYDFDYGSGISWPKEDALPTFSEPQASSTNKLDVVNISNASKSAQLTMVSLAGLVNREKPRIALYVDGGVRDGWVEELIGKGNYQVTTDYDAIIQKYRSYIKGIVTCSNLNIHSVNVATAVAGVEDYIVVFGDNYPYSYLYDLGFTEKNVIDLRFKLGTTSTEAYTWLYDNYYKTGKLNKRLIVTLSPEHHITYTRDMAVALKSAVLWMEPKNDDEKKVLDLFFNQATAGVTYNIGWWPEEDSGIVYTTMKGVSTIPADYFSNATVFSGQSKQIDMPKVPSKPKLENKMYVALAIADGDNTQYNQGTMKGHWINPRYRRSQDIPISWTVSPALYYMAPQLLNYYYKTMGNDMLISGPSGLGYTKATRWRYKSGFLDQYMKDTNKAFEKTGLSIVTIWDRISEATYEAFANRSKAIVASTINNNAFNDLDYNYSDSMYRFIFYYYPENQVVEYKNDLPIWGLGSKNGYIRNIGDAESDIRGKMANYDQETPLFVFKQFVPWDVSAAQISQMAKELKELYKNKIEFVRADHFFMLLNEYNHMPYNIALNKTASASQGTGAADGVDGTFATGWTSGSAVSGEAWYQLDLGERCEISRYTLKNAGSYTFNSSLNTKDYKFQYSLDNKTWYTADTVTGNTSDVVYKRFSNTIAARYVRILITNPGSDGIARIQDLEVYGNGLGITDDTQPVKVTKVKLSSPKSILNMGDSVQLSTTVSPMNAENRSITFTSSNTSLATVDANGKVKAKTQKKGGTVTITAKAKDGSGKSASVKLTIRTGKVEKISLNATKKSLNIGKKFTIKANIQPTTAKNLKVSYTSSNKSVATVSSKGVVTAKAAGTAKITVKAKDGSGIKAVLNVTVKPQKVSGLKVKRTSGGKKAIVTFKKSKGATKYQIFTRVFIWDDWKKVATISKTKYDKLKLNSKKQYYIRVRAVKTYKGKNIYGDYSKIIKV